MFALIGAVLVLSAPGNAGPAGQQSETKPLVKLDEKGALDACVAEPDQNRPLAQLTDVEKRAILACVTTQAASQINQQLPLKIDGVTTLEAVTATGVTLGYRYRVDLLATDLAPGSTEQLATATRNNVCASEDMRATIGMGGAYEYRWLDRKGAEIHRMRIDAC